MDSMLIQPDASLEVFVLNLYVVDLVLEVTVVGLEINYLPVHLDVLPVTGLVISHILLDVYPLWGVEGVDQVVQLGLDVPGHPQF